MICYNNVYFMKIIFIFCLLMLQKHTLIDKASKSIEILFETLHKIDLQLLTAFRAQR